MENELTSRDDIDKICNEFHAIITHAVNKNAPLRKATRKETNNFTKPWITSGIILSIIFKNKLLKMAIKSKSDSDFRKFKQYRI